MMSKDINWEYHQALNRVKELEVEMKELGYEIAGLKRRLSLLGWTV